MRTSELGYIDLCGSRRTRVVKLARCLMVDSRYNQPVARFGIICDGETLDVSMLERKLAMAIGSMQL